MTSRPFETPLVASVEGRGERPGRGVHGLGATPRQRCQRTRSALVRHVITAVVQCRIATRWLTKPHRLPQWRGDKRLGYTAFELWRGLVEGVIESLRRQRSLGLGGSRTEKVRTRKLGYDTFPSVGRGFRY